MSEDLRSEAYPEIEPFNTGMLRVSDLHSIFYEESGNKDGKAVVFVHAGPGYGCDPIARRFYDPAVYRIVLVDQRGSGKSTPPGELRENTTWDLVEDFEKLREHLGITKWHLVIGGSWGATLAMAYAETHPDKVAHLILFGIWAMRRPELLWLFQDGASRVHADLFDEFVKPIPEVERGDLMNAYYRIFTGDDKKRLVDCARAWSKWEFGILRFATKDDSGLTDDDDFVTKFARIECHYCVHGGFFKHEGQLLDDAVKLRDIPTQIIQGRYDMVCPFETAWDLHKRWPEADFKVIQAGHYFFEEPFRSNIVQACERIKHQPTK